MSKSPVICFGQQPCGFFPKRFLAAKVFTARRLQAEIGGEIVFFYHDSDHDPRETKTVLTHRQSHQPMAYNFEFANKIQRKFSPLFRKAVLPDWRRKITGALPNYVAADLAEMFAGVAAENVADFCLEMYRRMGLLDGIRVVRSGDPAFRQAACAIDDFFVDVGYMGELVRARRADGCLKLHEGGDVFITLPEVAFEKKDVSPTRDSRLKWMQSVVGCTHYVSGAGEQNYMRKEDAPEVEYVCREVIERSDEAYTEIQGGATNAAPVGG